MSAQSATISFVPLLPWPVIITLTAACVIILGFALYRRMPGAGWRAAAMLAGLLALTNPALLKEQREPLSDVAVIVVDESISQSIGERQKRTEQAAARLEALLRREDNLELRVVHAGGAADTDASSGRGTRLMETIQRSLNDVPRERIAGVVMITDGQVHDVPRQLKAADPGGPVHILLTGERDERDRRLVLKEAPRYGIVGGRLSMTLHVEEQGTKGKASTTVKITYDGTRVEEHRVPVNRPYSLPFTLEHGGPTIIEIDVSAGTGELTLKNNRAVLSVNGVRDRLRVLLVSGEPHAGERTWRNLLKSDPSVDLVHFTILRPPEKQDGTPIRELSLISFPTRELFQTKLHEFDLVIFDRYRRRGVLPDLYLRNIVDYVRRGGAVMSAAGPAFATPLSLYRTPLQDVLPAAPTGIVYTEGFRPRLSTLGRRHPVTADLPGAASDEPAWGRWFRMIDVENARGANLLEGVGGRPVLILGRAGKGRVAQLLSDHVWLWARGFEGGGPQAELLRRVAHWLMKEPDLEEEDLRATADGNRLQIVRRSLGEGAAEVTVTAPSGHVEKVALEDRGHGKATGSLLVQEPGLFRLSDGVRTAIAAVGDLNPKEYADLRTTDVILRPLAKATGGGVFWLNDGQPDVRRVKRGRDAVGRDWLGLRANQDYVTTGAKQTPLLPALLILTLFLGILMFAWHREGR